MGWREVCKRLTMTIVRASWAKIEPEKIELDDIVFQLSVLVFAVDHMSLIRMKFKTALLKSLRQLVFHIASMTLCATMNDAIIGISAERYVTMMRGHPAVECIMKKQIRKQR